MDKNNKTIKYKVLGFSAREGCGTTMYTKVEHLLPGRDEEEIIILHPSAPKTFTFEDYINKSPFRDDSICEQSVDLFVELPTDNRYITDDIHAVRCRCSKCLGIFNEILKNVDIKETKTCKADKYGNSTTIITTK